MPINYRRYHPKWWLIRRLILRRANYICEWCQVPDHSVGYWTKKTGHWYSPQQATPPAEGFINYIQARSWADAYNERIGEIYDPSTIKVKVVVLTISHIDHDIENNRFWNLAALCQFCHLSHDRIDNADRRRYGPKGRHHNQIRLLLH